MKGCLNSMKINLFQSLKSGRTITNLNYNKSTNLLIGLQNSKNFSRLETILQPISYSQSKINKNAVIIQNEHYYTKIIFPDYKFSLNLNLEDPNYTIKNLLDDSRKSYNKDMVMSISFFDEEGELIANSTKVSILSRLPNFKICMDGGDRIYNCINPFWNGNKNISIPVLEKNSNIDLNRLEDFMFNQGLTYKEAESMSNSQRNFSTSNESLKIKTYKKVLKNYLANKYTNVSNFTQSITTNREQRIQKFLNFFFYMCLSQTVALNLCTFVFFSWDFMEPITTCITYLNLIMGYYFWAGTNTDYEMESMIGWLRKRKFITKPTMWRDMLEEKDEIKEIIAKAKSIYETETDADQ